MIIDGLIEQSFNHLLRNNNQFIREWDLPQYIESLKYMYRRLKEMDDFGIDLTQMENIDCFNVSIKSNVINDIKYSVHIRNVKTIIKIYFRII